MLLVRALGMVARGQLFYCWRERREDEPEHTTANQIEAVAVFGLHVQSLAGWLFT